MSQKKNLFKALPVIVVATLLVVVIIYAWTEPGSAPPTGNVPAPVNVGPNPQYKSAALGVGGLSVDYDANLATLGGDVKVGTISQPTTFQVNGTCTATTFSGDGSHLSGIGPAAIPSGVIVMWSGTIANIPSGWALCDGTNGTPDLRDKFVYGVSAGQNPGATGGAISHTHSAPGGLVSTSFDSSWNQRYGMVRAQYGQFGEAPYRLLIGKGHWTDMPYYISYDGELGRDANLTGSDLVCGGGETSSANHLPPYYKLAYIMKL